MSVLRFGRVVFKSQKNNNLMRSISSTNVINSSDSNLVLIDINDKTGYATLSLNRHPANSFNLDLLNAFDYALGQLETHKPRGMILTSTIPKIFSVGFDIREMYQPDPKRIREFWRKAQDCWVKLFGSLYPTASAINGHNPAAGCFFTMACEYRVMVPNSKIGLSGARLGICMPNPIIKTMQSILSSRQSEIAILNGTLFSTDEALKIGLIDEIASDKSEAIIKCEKYLNRLKKIPPNARGKTKQNIRRADIDAVLNNRDKDIEEFVESICSPEAQASFEKFISNLTVKD